MAVVKKFETRLDKDVFMLENKLTDHKDELELVISETLNKEIKDRKKRIKNVKKSNDSKKNWRVNRKKIKRGMKKFHKSTEGKRFHRKLGRLVATRDSKSKNEDFSQEILLEWLVGVQSLLVHLAIQETYSSSVEADAEVELMHEYARGILVPFSEGVYSSISGDTSLDEVLTDDVLEVLKDLLEDNLDE